MGEVFSIQAWDMPVSELLYKAEQDHPNSVLVRTMAFRLARATIELNELEKHCIDLERRIAELEPEGDDNEH